MSSLKNINNPISDGVLNLMTKNLASVEDSYYEETVWTSKENYSKLVGTLRTSLESNFGKQLVETPLTFLRGQHGSTFLADPGKGISCGTVLIDYIKKTPLLVVLIDKSTSGYSYKSLKFNNITKEYEILSDLNQDFSDLISFINFCNNSLSSDIETFIEIK
jgi:hypothetical protein